MNTVQRIAKNTGVLLTAQIASYIIGFFFIMYQTLRKFDQNASRQTFEKSLIKMLCCSFALAFTGIFGVFSDFGLSTLTVREVARDKSLAGKYLGNVAVMKMTYKKYKSPSSFNIFLNRKLQNLQWCVIIVIGGLND